MDEKPYTKREIDAHNKTVNDKLDTAIALVTETNGKIAAVKKWREQMVGGGKVLVVVLFPLLTWALIQIVHIPDTVRTVMAEQSK